MTGGRLPTIGLLMLAAAAGFAEAGRRGAAARYLGGTLPALEARLERCPAHRRPHLVGV